MWKKERRDRPVVFLACCISASALDCTSEEHAIYPEGGLKVCFQSAERRVVRVHVYVLTMISRDIIYLIISSSFFLMVT